MSELLKKRRKLAAVRLQFWNQPPQEIEKYLCDKLVLPQNNALPRRRLWTCPAFFRWRPPAGGRPQQLFYPPAKLLQAPAGTAWGARWKRTTCFWPTRIRACAPLSKCLWPRRLIRRSSASK